MIQLIQNTDATNLVNPQLIVDMIQKRAWLPLGALGVGIAVRLLKSDIIIFPDLAPRYRIWAAFALGQVLGVIETIIAGKTYREAILWGLTQSVIAILGQNIFIESLRGGKEIPIPGLTAPGVAPGPGKPPSIPAPVLSREELAKEASIGMETDAKESNITLENNSKIEAETDRITPDIEPYIPPQKEDKKTVDNS